MDEDLNTMSRDQLIEEVKKLRHGIRAHRDTSLHELCWHHPALWGLLPERTDPQPVVPEWPESLRGCIRYRQSFIRHALRSLDFAAKSLRGPEVTPVPRSPLAFLRRRRALRTDPLDGNRSVFARSHHLRRKPRRHPEPGPLTEPQI